MAIINCPKCAGRLKFPDDSPPRRVKCPTCSHSFLAGPAGVMDEPVEKASEPAPKAVPKKEEIVEDFEVVDDDKPESPKARDNEDDRDRKKKSDDDDDRPRAKKNRDDDDDDDRDRKKRRDDDEIESGRPRSRSARDDDDDDRDRKKRRDDDEVESSRPRSKSARDDDDDDRDRKKRRDDDDDDRPRSRRVRDDDDDRDRKKRRDDNDEDRPRSRRGRDDDDDDRDRKKRRDDDDEDRPRSRRDRDDDDDDDRPRSKKKGRRDNDGKISARANRVQWEWARKGISFINYGLYCHLGSFGALVLAFLIAWMGGYEPVIIALACLPGAVGLILSGIGFGFIVAGPRRGNLLGLSIALAATSGLHLILTTIAAFGEKSVGVMYGYTSVNWLILPTAFVEFAIMVIVKYGEALIICTGLVEIARFVLLTLWLKDLGKICKEREASGRCTMLMIALPSTVAGSIVIALLGGYLLREAMPSHTFVQIFALLYLIAKLGAYAFIYIMTIKTANEISDSAYKMY